MDPPLPVAFLLEFIFCERERDFSGLRILPWKLVHLQLGLKRLFWLFSPSFGGEFPSPTEMQHGALHAVSFMSAQAAVADCATATNPVATFTGKPFAFGTHPA